MTLQNYNQLQMQEMERYKWIESEKAGRDLGEEALLQWVKQFGRSFREKYFTADKSNT